MASYNRTKIGFLADFWKFWFCCFSSKFAHFGLFFDLFDFNSSNSSGPCAFICWGRQMQWIWRSRREHGLSEKCWFGPYWHLHLAVRWSPENVGLLIWDGGSIYLVHNDDIPSLLLHSKIQLFQFLEYLLCFWIFISVFGIFILYTMTS